MLLNGTIVESIVVRNDEYYPSSSSLIKYDELYNMIEKLRKLNDTILNNYIEEFKEAVNERNYSRIEEVLEKIKAYINNRYIGTSNMPQDIVETYSLISSIEDVGSGGVEINLDRYFKYINRYFGEIKGYERGHSIIELLFSETSSNGTTNRIGNRLTRGSRDSTSIFKPSSMLRILFSIPIEPIYLIPILALLIGMLMYSYRSRFSSLLRGLDLLSYKVKSMIYRSIYFLNPSNWKTDPVIRLYNYWYLLVKMSGFRRVKSETLREFLSRLEIDYLKKYGENVTKLYEDRVYGDIVVERGKIEAMEEELKRKFGEYMWRD